MFINFLCLCDELLPGNTISVEFLALSCVPSEGFAVILMGPRSSPRESVIISKPRSTTRYFLVTFSWYSKWLNFTLLLGVLRL